jgi:hypothetical protein
MVIEQKSSRKPRRPSPTLWVMTHKLNDDQWRELKAYSQAYGKQTMQFKLLEFLRAMPTYDPEAEKRQFSNCNLISMRSVAKNWLIRTARTLGFYTHEVEQHCLDVGVLIQWKMYDVALEFIEEAKQKAIDQEEFGWLGKIYEQEMAVVRAHYQGDFQTAELLRLNGLAVDNLKWQMLGMEVEEFGIRSRETNKNMFISTGMFDERIARNYFDSEFFHRPIDSWPITIQIQKLRIDEANYYFLGDRTGASASAEKILALLNGYSSIRSKLVLEHLSLLFRISAYYFDLRNKKGVEKVITAFKQLAPSTAACKEAYWGFYLHTLCRYGFESENLSIALEGVTVWDQHRDLLMSSPINMTTLTSLLYVCSYHVAVRNIALARDTFNTLYEFSSSIRGLSVEGVYKILHLVILLEEDDDRGLESYGASYKRHLKPSMNSDSTNPFYTIVTGLSKRTNLSKAFSLGMELKSLKQQLIHYHQSTATTFKPFTFAFIQWVEGKLKALDVD